MRVRLALHEKEIPFETIEEDLAHLSDALRALHPEAKVPVLVHGQNVVYESSIILEYIEDAFPEKPRFMPIEASHKAQVRLWGYWCNQHFKPAIDRFKYGTHRFPEMECEGIGSKVEGHLAQVENTLSHSEWLVGEKYSLADLLVFPFARQLVRVQPTPLFLPKYPKLMNWVERISKRSAFEKTLEK